MTFSRDEKIAFIQLIRTKKIGPTTFRRLLKYFGSAEKIIENIPAIVSRIKGAKNIDLYDRSKAESELGLAEKNDIKILFLGDENYPIKLAELNDAPPVLFVKTNYPERLKMIAGIGVVGTRNASLPAIKFTNQISSELVRKEKCVISGMALGIDTAAHDGALNQGGLCPTIAVLAGGVDKIYPARNADLYHRIIESGGAIVSEMPIGTQPAAGLFPARNRLIAGLSAGVLVVEAKEKSGSLITADYAAQQGRVIFAVPGFPNDPRSGGPNKLIKEGATVVENADDILKGLIRNKSNNLNSPEYDLFSVQDRAELSEDENLSLQEKVLNCLGKTPVSMDELYTALNVSITELSLPLLELELSGMITMSANNEISKI